MVFLFSIGMIMTPSIYPAIEKVQKYAEDICIHTYEGDWDGKDCDIQEAVDEQKYYDQIASLEDTICQDTELKDISHEDWVDLCENFDVFEK